HDITPVRQCGQEQERDISRAARLALQCSQEAVTVHPRHADVAENQIRPGHFALRQCFLTRCRFNDTIAGFAEFFGNVAPQHLFILNAKNKCAVAKSGILHGHGPVTCPYCGKGFEEPATGRAIVKETNLSSEASKYTSPSCNRARLRAI